MGAKKILPFYRPFTAQAVSSTTVYTSPTTYIANLDNIGAQVAFVGTMTGTLVVNVSNDGISFDALTFSPPLAQPTGAALHFAINLNQLSWPYLQFVYTNASGSGTLNLSITGKDLN